MVKLILLILLATSGLRAEWQQSYAPIVGFDSTSGTQYGAAAFLEDPKTYIEVMGIASEYGVYMGIFELRQRLGEHLRFEGRQSLANFFDNYYGEGNQTLLKDRLRLDQMKYTGRFALLAHDGALELGPFAEWRWREPQGIDGDRSRSLFAGETTAVAGLQLALDSRSGPGDPLSGGLLQLKGWLHPAADPGSPAFGQASSELRGYWTPLGGLTLAARLGGSWTWGPATYRYRFSQGGGWVLRGYGFNRFRGDREASGSLEARFPIKGWFSGAVFAESGEVGDELRGKLRSSGGGGIRLALPPDGLMKARLDYGRGSDEDGIVLEFGQAF